MEIHLRDLVMRLDAPTPIQEFLHSNESLAQSKGATAEGGDFRLEVRNRRIAIMLRPGVPNDKNWVEACQCVLPLKH